MKCAIDALEMHLVITKTTLTTSALATRDPVGAETISKSETNDVFFNTGALPGLKASTVDEYVQLQRACSAIHDRLLVFQEALETLLERLRKHGEVHGRPFAANNPVPYGERQPAGVSLKGIRNDHHR